jgi:hypothetical protein
MPMMETSHVAKLGDEKTGFRHAANNRVKALRQLFAWATSPEYGYVKKNPGEPRQAGGRGSGVAASTNQQ